MHVNDLQLLSGGITFKFYQNLSTTSNPRCFLVESDVSLSFFLKSKCFRIFFMVRATFYPILHGSCQLSPFFSPFLSLLESTFCQKHLSEIHHFPQVFVAPSRSASCFAAPVADQSGHGAHGAADVLRGLWPRGADPLDVGGHRDLLWAGAAQYYPLVMSK